MTVTDDPPPTAWPPPNPVIAVRWRWAEHAGTALTLGYLTMVLIGMFHSWIRYFRFRINIFDFAEPADFLMAPIRDPLVIAATVIPIVVAWGYLSGTDRLGNANWDQRRAAGKPIAWWEFTPANMARYNRLKFWYWPVMTGTWVLAAGLWYAKRSADATMTGHGDSVLVEYTSGQREEGPPNRPVMLIGASSKYLFLFRTAEWKAVVVPIENVSRLLPTELARGSRSIRPLMERRLDSLAATPANSR